LKYFSFFLLILISCQQTATSEIATLPIQDNVVKSNSKKSNSEDNKDYQSIYEKYINASKLNIEQIDGDSLKRQNFTTYLGKIADDKNQLNLFILKQFWTLQMAISRKGHSDLIFMDTLYKKSYIYTFDMPNDLPYLLRGNYLLSKFDSQIDSIYLDNSPPKILCIPNKNCAEY